MKICLAFCYFVCLPQPLLILQTFMLPDNPDDIILRAITISANLLSSLGNYSQVQTSDKIITLRKEGNKTWFRKC